MVGGAGFDIYYVDNAGDVIIEEAGKGTDELYASASYTLAAGVSIERITLTGTDNINITGNEIDSQIFGNSGDNVINGGAGADYMVGGAGNDTYFITDVGDRAIEGTDEGYDQIYSAISYDLTGSHIEKISLTRSSDINAIGNGLNNVIVGNSGANIISGNNGNDFLYGGLGLDTISGGSGKDCFIFDTIASADNVDTITDFTAVDDQIWLARSKFTAFSGQVAFDASQFHTGATALEANDYIIYDSATGSLFYDADGSGAGAMVQFAKLSPMTALSADDFLLI